MTSLFAVLGVLIAALIGSLGSLFLKKGSDSLKLSFRALATNTSLLFGFLFYGLSVIFFIISLKHGELSVLYPLVSTSYIWTCLLSIRYLGEKMNRYKWTGIGLIIIGVSCIGLGSAL